MFTVFRERAGRAWRHVAAGPGAHGSSPAGEALQVLGLQQGLQPEAGPGRAPEDAHRGEALPVRRESPSPSCPGPRVRVLQCASVCVSM